MHQVFLAHSFLGNIFPLNFIWLPNNEEKSALDSAAIKMLCLYLSTLSRNIKLSSLLERMHCTGMYLCTNWMQYTRPIIIITWRWPITDLPLNSINSLWFYTQMMVMIAIIVHTNKAVYMFHRLGDSYLLRHGAAFQILSFSPYLRIEKKIFCLKPCIWRFYLYFWVIFCDICG